MNFEYEIKVTPFDFFIMTMKKTYKSFIGVCNIVFTIAAILLTVKFYNSVNDVLQLLLIIMCIIFPVFQPLGVYFKAKAQVLIIPEGLKLMIDDTGILVSLNQQSEKLKWKRVNGYIDTGSMLVIKVDNKNGYFLTKKVLKGTKEELKAFINSKLGK